MQHREELPNETVHAVTRENFMHEPRSIANRVYALLKNLLLP